MHRKYSENAEHCNASAETGAKRKAEPEFSDIPVADFVLPALGKLGVPAYRHLGTRVEAERSLPLLQSAQEKPW